MRSTRSLALAAALAFSLSGVPPAMAQSAFGTLDSGISLFTASDAASGLEVWRSDGTARGTFRLTTRVCNDSCETANLLFAPWALAGDRAFFVVQDEHGTSELWVTDGTRRGTSLVLDGAPPSILTRAPFAEPLWVESLGLLFFLAGDSEDGYDLWRSDGTPAGTFQVKELDARRGESPAIGELTEFKGRIFFRAQDFRGPSLWTSDGTAAGTTLVRDPVRNQQAHAGPSWLRVVGSRLLFFFPTPGLGTELWASDGTRAGSRLIADMEPGPGSPVISDVQVVGGRLFLSASVEGRRGHQLWVSNGTPTGLRALGGFSEPPHLPGLPLFKGRYYFEALDPFDGTEIWSTDGTRAGTRELADICPGECSGVVPGSLAIVGNRLLFAGQDSSHGVELWLSDGTAQGTRMVQDLCPGACSSSPHIYAVDGRILFSAASSSSAPRQLWRTDGTAQGTARLTDFAGHGVTDELVGTTPDGLLFRVVSESGLDQLWASDGTRPGTRLLKTIRAGG